MPRSRRAADEVRPVRIVIHFTGVVQAVAIEVAPPVGGRHRGKRVGHLVLFHEPLFVEPAPTTFEHGGPVARDVVREIQAGCKRCERLEGNLFGARSLCERPRACLAALLRNVRRVVLEASTEFQRQSPRNRPRVAAIRGREPHVVLRYGWIVIELDLRRSSDLSCCAAGEDQAVLAGGSAVAVPLDEPVGRVLEPRFELMVSLEQIGLEVGGRAPSRCIARCRSNCRRWGSGHPAIATSDRTVRVCHRRGSHRSPFGSRAPAGRLLPWPHPSFPRSSRSGPPSRSSVRRGMTSPESCPALPATRLSTSMPESAGSDRGGIPTPGISSACRRSDTSAPTCSRTPVCSPAATGTRSSGW